MMYPELPTDAEFEKDGYGSIMDTTNDVFSVTVRAGDDAFLEGQYIEALQKYDMAIHMDPTFINLKINRAETLICLGRFGEALDIFRSMVLVDPNHGLLHDAMSRFFLRTGVIDLAEDYVKNASPHVKEGLRARIEKVKDHLIEGKKARHDRNWSSALNQFNAMIEDGVDISQTLLAYRAEMLLRLDQLEETEQTIKRAVALEPNVSVMFKNVSMAPMAYLELIIAQIELAMGRFHTAIAAADRAHVIDMTNSEVTAIWTRVHLECEARLADSACTPR